MKKLILITALVPLAAFAQAEGEWVDIATSDVAQSYVRKDTYTFVANSAKTYTLSIIGKSVRKSDGALDVVRWTLDSKACQDKFGEISISSPTGVLRQKADYVRQAGNTASVYGDFLCMIHEHYLENLNKK